jgi:hypothetical protein
MMPNGTLLSNRNGFNREIFTGNRSYASARAAFYHNRHVAANCTKPVGYFYPCNHQRHFKNKNHFPLDVRVMLYHTMS